MEKIKINKTTKDDLSAYLKVMAREFSEFYNKDILFQELTKDFTNKFANELLYRITYNNLDIAFICLIKENEDTYSLSYAILEEYEGKGIMTYSLKEIMKLYPNNKFIAKVICSNYRSKQLLLNNNFKLIKDYYDDDLECKIEIYYGE